MALKKKTLFTTRISADREKKNLLFLNLIKSRKSTSRTELSKLTDVNIVTVSNYINSYIKKGLIAERGYDVSSGGRRPELIELNRKWGYVIGIDIGENRIKGALAGLDMEILASESMDGCDGKNIKNFIDKIIQKLLSDSGIDKGNLRKIGMGVSAVSDDAMADMIKIKDTIEDEMGIPVLCGSGALCGASAEKSLNPGAIEEPRVVYIYRDVGQGILIRDNEFYEASDEAPSYAYLKPWWQGQGIVTEEMMKAALVNDKDAIDLIRTTGVNLGVRIAYLINLFEPQCVIIGGGIEEAGELFLDALRSSIDRFVLREVRNKVKLTPAVSGKETCVKGAAFLALREALIEA